MVGGEAGGAKGSIAANSCCRRSRLLCSRSSSGAGGAVATLKTFVMFKDAMFKDFESIGVNFINIYERIFRTNFGTKAKT